MFSSTSHLRLAIGGLVRTPVFNSRHPVAGALHQRKYGDFSLIDRPDDQTYDAVIAYLETVARPRFGANYRAITPSASVDADASNRPYRWDFGDGTVVSGSAATIVTHTYLQPGQYIVRLTVEDDDGASAEQSQSIVVGDLPDLEIVEVAPIQVVVGADLGNDNTIDLVRDKSTVVRVMLSLQNALTFPQDAPITTRMILGGQEIASDTKSLAQLSAAAYRHDFYFVPTIPGSTVIEVIVESPVPELTTDNNRKPVDVTVHDARPLYIAYLRVGCSPPSIEAFRKSVQDASAFVEGIFPVAETKLIQQPFDALSDDNRRPRIAAHLRSGAGRCPRPS